MKLGTMTTSTLGTNSIRDIDKTGNKYNTLFTKAAKKKSYNSADYIPTSIRNVLFLNFFKLKS